MLIWIVVFILGAAASLGGVLPAMNAYAYTIIGICVGYVGAAVIGCWAYEGGGLRPHHVVAVAVIVGGGAIGLFWPASLATGAAWLIARYVGGGRGRAAGVVEDVEDLPTQSHARRRS